MKDVELGNLLTPPVSSLKLKTLYISFYEKTDRHHLPDPCLASWNYRCELEC